MSSYIVKAKQAKVPLFYLSEDGDLRHKIFSRDWDLIATKDVLVNISRVQDLPINRIYGMVLFEIERNGTDKQKFVTEEALKVMNPTLTKKATMKSMVDDYTTFYNAKMKDLKDLYKQYTKVNKIVASESLSMVKSTQESYQDKSMEVVIKSNTTPVTIYTFDNMFAQINATYDIPIIAFVSRHGIRVKTHISMNFYDVVESESINLDKTYSSGIYLFTRNGERIDILFPDMVAGYGSIKLDILTTVKNRELYEKSLIQCMEGVDVEIKFGTSKMIQMDGRLDVKKTINMPAFAHLMYTNDVFTFHTYAVERTNTIFEKATFMFRFKQLKTRCRLDKDGYFSIMGSKEKSVIDSTKTILITLVSLCAKKQRETMVLYRSLLPDLKKEFTSSKPILKEHKKGRKMGKKATALIRKRPYLFRKTYASICQRRQAQPIIVEKVPTKANPNKYFEFENPADGEADVYTCDDPKYSWIGLKKNTSVDQTYTDEVPYFPCCFTKNQYEKTSSALKKYLGDGDIKDIDVPGTRPLGYILRSDKIARDGKYAHVPQNFGRIAILGGYKSETPFLRYGMNLSVPDSFVHSILLLVDNDYAQLTFEERKIKARRTRQNLSKHNVFVAKQELFDIDESTIKTLLRSEDYMNPILWVRLLEDYYKVVIHLYDMKHDKIMLPRYAKTHISPTYESGRKHIIVGVFGQHTEIVVKNEGKSNLPGLYDESEKLVKVLSKLEKTTMYRYVPSEGLAEYKPPVYESGKSQYIDVYGKMQMIEVDGVPINIPPSAPIAAPILKGTSVSKLTQYQKARKIADLYKSYTTLLYFLNDLQPLSKDNFHIMKDHVFSLFHEFDSANFIDRKLVVPSKEFRTRLIDFSTVLHSFGKRSTHKDYNSLDIGSSIPSAYRSISDFDIPADQHLFFTVDSFVMFHEYKWMVYLKDVDDSHNIQEEIIPEAVFPYFYQGKLFGGVMVMIQNLKTDGKSIVESVLRKWNVDNVNPGFYADDSYKELNDIPIIDIDDTFKGVLDANALYRFMYPTGRYAAILTL